MFALRTQINFVELTELQFVKVARVTLIGQLRSCSTSLQFVFEQMDITTRQQATTIQILQLVSAEIIALYLIKQIASLIYNAN